jgi:hypothetical protein
MLLVAGLVQIGRPSALLEKQTSSDYDDAILLKDNPQGYLQIYECVSAAAGLREM